MIISPLSLFFHPRFLAHHCCQHQVALSLHTNCLSCFIRFPWLQACRDDRLFLRTENSHMHKCRSDRHISFFFLFFFFYNPSQSICTKCRSGGRSTEYDESVCRSYVGVIMSVSASFFFFCLYTPVRACLMKQYNLVKKVHIPSHPSFYLGPVPRPNLHGAPRILKRTSIRSVPGLSANKRCLMSDITPEVGSHRLYRG